MSNMDLVIIGGGPAGSAAAITAAKAGLKAVIVDKATFPRDKCCGDGLTAVALRELELLGLAPQSLESWQAIDTVELRSCSGHRATLPLGRSGGLHAAIVRRSELDAELVSLARSAGAEVREGDGFASLDQATTTVKTTSGHSIRARHVIAADGMWSPVRRSLGLNSPSYRGDLHAFRQYMSASGPQSRDLWIWFDADLLPGYAWSFPLPNGVVNFGFGLLRGKTLDGAHMKAVWEGLADRPHIRAVLGQTTPESPHKAWPIPARMDSAVLAHGSVMFVGDAAAVTDPLTGEGIGQALETGRMAAQACATETQPQEAGEQYEKSVRRHLQLDHRFSRGLSKILSHPWVANTAIRAAGSCDWTRHNFGRWMFEDYPRAALLTPGRWNDMRKRPGPFPDSP
jgi:geranylgeranyl reductase family protein